MLLQSHVYTTYQPNLNTARGIFMMFRDEAMLVHGEKDHSILEEIGIEDDETMFAVLTREEPRNSEVKRISCS
jgi:hypothetical protein